MIKMGECYVLSMSMIEEIYTVHYLFSARFYTTQVQLGDHKSLWTSQFCLEEKRFII